ncbi:tonsoku-like protein isoform X2 [Apostichopus japonicus]|uniref:tonsoku-like protein isoform X2 n=1 Tax=Stichopus japonicus TaxID=307972 RepID=UPI003AB8445E
MKTPERIKLARLMREKLKFSQSGKARKEAEIDGKIGRLHIRNGSYQEAIKAFKDEMEIWTRQKDAMGEAMSHRSLGECFAEVGYFPIALSHHHQYMAWAESNKNYPELQRALATLGRTYICKAASADEKGSSEATTSISKSEEAFLRSMSVCDNHLAGLVSDNELQQMKARLYLNLGLVYLHQESYPKSIVSIEKAVKISQEHNKMEDLYRGHLSLGDVYLRMNNTSQSLQSLDIAFSISKKLKDKEKESDVLIQRAHVHFILGEYAAAEGVLRRVCAIGAMKVTEKQSIIDQIKVAKKCCKLQAELKTAMEEVNLKRVMVIHEQLGDCCCKVNIYREALLHYNKQLECALTLQLPDEQLSPIYVSLAATYADSQQYGMAVTMYGKELQLREGNSKEECKTWLNVADAQEKAGHSYEALQESYNKASKFALKAGKPKLQRRVLKSLAIVQERFGQASDLHATRENLAKLKKDYQLGSDNDSLSEEEDQVPLAELSVESEEDIEALVNGPEVKREKDSSNLQSHSEDILNNWLDTNEEEIPQEPVRVRIKLEALDHSEPFGDPFTPGVPPAKLLELHDIQIKTEPAEETATSDFQQTVDQTKGRWSIKSKKGKTLISRNSPTKAKKRTLSDSHANDKIKRYSPKQSKGKVTRPKDVQDDPLTVRGKLIEKYYTGDRNVARKYFETTDEADGAGTSEDRDRSREDIGGNPVSSSNTEVPLSEPYWGHMSTENPGVSPDSSLPHPTVEERMPSIAFVHPPQKSRMRVRVRFKRTTYLVNVPRSSIPPLTFQWLADQAALRYQESHGLRPKLSLSTTDCALIAASDVVCETLADNEEVIANIDSLITTPSQDKPPQSTKASQGDLSSRLGSIASVVETHPLMPKPVSLLIQEQCQLSVQVLCLSQSHICDEGIAHLADTLQSLPHITRMDLSHNAITYKGLQSLTQILFPESEERSSQCHLENLKDLVLSHNPLGDNSALYIANLVSHCHKLNELYLTASQLTTQFVMDHHAVVLQTAFEGAPNLQVLDVSHNALGSTGIDMLMKFLNPEILTTLNFSSVIEDKDAMSLCNHIASYFKETQCALHTLYLEGCNLCDSDMQALSTCIPFTKFWHHVSLSSNTGITNQGLVTLLRGWNTSGCRVGSLDASLCGLVSLLGQELITLLIRFMTSTDQSEGCMTTLKLSNNKLSDSDLELLKSIWLLGHGTASSLLIEQMQAVFSTDEEKSI